VGSLCCLGTGGKPAPLSVITQMNLGPQHKGIASAAQLADLLAAAQVSPGLHKGLLVWTYHSLQPPNSHIGMDLVQHSTCADPASS
jgi:hypothetical protein